MAKIKITVIGYRCERCGHEWIPRLSLEDLKSGKVDEAPVICPKCKSPYWDRPKKDKDETSNQK